MRLVCIAIALVLVGACGYKGPLYLPDSKPPARKPAGVVVPPPSERPQPSEAVPPPQ